MKKLIIKLESKLTSDYEVGYVEITNINDVDFAICYIDTIEDKNEKEKFAKYLLDNEHFLETTNGLLDFVQDEKERELYIKKQNRIMNGLEDMSWK
jgi:hypothetical protein